MEKPPLNNLNVTAALVLLLLLSFSLDGRAKVNRFYSVLEKRCCKG
jgi:hypothetical protein